jgi:hypothetical protein
VRIADDPLHSFHCSFAGVACAQYWADFYLWEGLLNAYPKTKAIVEIGTWQGGFSLYLHAQAEARGLRFRTYDVLPPSRQIPGFVQLDVFADAEHVGRHLSKQGEVILLLDGGNKPRELKTFPLYCQEGSIFVVHDWGTEIFPQDVPDDLIEIHTDLCERIGSMSRVFTRRD